METEKKSVHFYCIMGLFLAVSLLSIQCQHDRQGGALNPEASLRTMQIEAGFQIELVAAEPLVVAPVAMTFDEHGRMWVVEMDGYMPDTLGNGEDAPVGRVVILADDNGDGHVDERTVFLDSLVMPRAICLVAGGALVAEPPNLWFYEIANDRPVRKLLVDSAYTEGGNVEHQPNGLFRALDNWIYSAKSDQRYRQFADGTWAKEKTHFRGQWGISQDDWGRLYYNDNSSNLFGDYFPAGLGAANPNQREVAGYRETIVSDTRVYPIHPTTGVNRGYKEETLDSTGRLLNFTAACGPLVYRGGLVPGLNAFVAEPAANLIKRNVLDTVGYRTSGVQAYRGREFLASDDERFRPVGLYDGPDGSIYVLDMYRGIIQHSTYLTPYLKGEIAARDLTRPVGMGRIYRIVPKGVTAERITMPQSVDSLVALLGHANGWVRDKAQQTLVDRCDTGAVEGLRTVVRHGSNPLQVVHALWTLEGIGRLAVADVEAVLDYPRWQVRAQAIASIPSLAATMPATQSVDLIAAAISDGDSLLMPYAALAIASIAAVDDQAAFPIMQKWAVDYANNAMVVDALISGLAGDEKLFMQKTATRLPDTATALFRRLSIVVDEIENKTDNHSQLLLAKRYPDGISLFQATCQPCHGEDGRGVSPIAPPLAGSHWVTGDKNRLMALVLYGLTGPVDVAGHTYEAPQISGEMPGIAHNTTIDDAALAELLSYIRNAWGNATPDEVLPEDVGMVRSAFGDRVEPFTQAELYHLYGKN